VPRPSLIAALVAFGSLAWADQAGAAFLSQDPPGEASAMRTSVDHALHWIATVIEVAGVGVIVVGGLVASALFLRQGLRAGAWSAAYHQYRANLCRGILLGLELLVAADIIGTVAVTPSFQTLGVLALIVLIRTFLSFSLEIEIEGRWPWRRHEAVGERPGGERF
jgi:uncharacterized membrane protein